MTLNPRHFSAAFQQSVQLLLQLHHEMSAGDPDGKKADEIRDAMERPWDAMSEAEHRLVRGLSADLYTIGRPWDVGPEPQTDIVGLVMDSLKNKRCEELLDLLRLHERRLPPESIAYLRGMAWSLLGQFETAAEFFQEATKVGPREWTPYVHCFLQALIAAERIDQAIVHAERVASQSSDPLLLLDAAEVFFVRSTEVDDANAESVIKMARTTAERGLRLAEQAQQDDVLTSQRVLIHLWLALDSARLNDLTSALREVAIAQKLMPENPSIPFVEAFLMQRSDPISWDQGVGKGFVRLRSLQTDVSGYAPELMSAHSVN